MVFLSFGLWVHDMFAVGIPHLALAFFSAASMLVAVPTAVQIFAWIGTIWRGRPDGQHRFRMLRAQSPSKRSSSVRTRAVYCVARQGDTNNSPRQAPRAVRVNTTTHITLSSATKMLPRMPNSPMGRRLPSRNVANA